MIFRAKNYHYSPDPTEEIEDLDEILNQIYNEKEERGMERYYENKTNQ